MLSILLQKMIFSPDAEYQEVIKMRQNIQNMNARIRNNMVGRQIKSANAELLKPVSMAALLYEQVHATL